MQCSMRSSSKFSGPSVKVESHDDRIPASESQFPPPKTRFLTAGPGRLCKPQACCSWSARHADSDSGGRPAVGALVAACDPELGSLPAVGVPVV